MIEVINSLLSYLLLVLVIVVTGGTAIFLGIFFNKIKEKRIIKNPCEEQTVTEE